MTTSEQSSTCLALTQLVQFWTERVVEPKLAAATLGRRNRTKYSYGANGLRINRTDSAGVVNYLLTGPSVLEELDSLGQPVTQLLNHPQALDDVVSFDKGGATYYPLADALGSIYATTNSAGTIAHRYDYDVWGVRTDLGGVGLGIDFGAQGRWHDANGLVDHRDRLRNPRVGVWLQPDHAEQQLALAKVGRASSYLALGANAATNTDPTGQFTLLELIIVVVILAVLVAIIATAYQAYRKNHPLPILATPPSALQNQINSAHLSTLRANSTPLDEAVVNSCAGKALDAGFSADYQLKNGKQLFSAIWSAHWSFADFSQASPSDPEYERIALTQGNWVVINADYATGCVSGGDCTGLDQIIVGEGQHLAGEADTPETQSEFEDITVKFGLGKAKYRHGDSGL